MVQHRTMNEDVQFKIRMPADLKARLEDVARLEGKSLTTVIVQRLEDSFPMLEEELLDRRQAERARLVLEISRLTEESVRADREVIIRKGKLGGADAKKDPESIQLQAQADRINARLEQMEELYARYDQEVEFLEGRVRELMGPAFELKVAERSPSMRRKTSKA